MRNQIDKWRKTVIFAYFMVALSALLYTFGIQAVMTAARALPSGLGAFAILPSVIDPALSKYFAFFYLAINLPFLIYFYKKIKRRFIYRTCFFLLITTIIGALQFNPQVDHFFTNDLEQLIVKRVKDESGNLLSLEQTTYKLIWPMLVLPAIAGVLVGSAIAISWKYGGSTAGTDIVTYYFSTKKKKQIGQVSAVVSLVVLFATFGIFLGVNNSGIKEVWFASISGSITYILISNLIVNIIYPKYKKVLVYIHSSKIEDICVWLDKHYSHAYRIEKSFSRFDRKEKEHVATVMLLLETKDFVRAIRMIDKDAWVAISRVEKIFGKFDTSYVE